MFQCQEKQDFLPLANSLQGSNMLSHPEAPVVSLGSFLSKCLLQASLPLHIVNPCPYPGPFWVMPRTLEESRMAATPPAVLRSSKQGWVP